MIKEGLDTEYLISMIAQARCKVNGMKNELNKKGFKECPGIMLHGDHLSLEYMREKANVFAMMLDTIERDILLKSGRLRKLEN